MTATASLSARKPARTEGWLLAGFQFAYAAWYAVCFASAVAHAKEFSGFWYIPSVDDQFTATEDVYAGWAWAEPVMWTVGMAPMVLGFSLVASVLTLIVGYAKGRRNLFAALIGGLVVTIMTLAFSLTPAGLSVAGWLID
ncbi:hypothetical protein ACTI_70040 [Actinoplanes sp. OR16]|uniref:hypothetical protein n=1 Tax=Actinoplanes sp. OR16 TaxID=946334 RepID=UPI000F6DD12E|nr:hypothetical protein [Actinoplanes sp. OR16]BBH70319.1 hypothetical protein ACTI_70040 [Actinoplanes sp. OR16]